MPLRLLLVRHGESVDNVAGLYAGSRDSPLTNHGVLQAGRLGAHLAGRSAAIGPVKHIFTSNLRRAVKTAEAISEAQSAVDGIDQVPEVIQLPELREKDFGSDEGKRFGKRGAEQGSASSSAEYVAPESQEAMQARINRFIDAVFVPTVIRTASAESRGSSIAIVAHGIILNVLLRCLLARFGSEQTPSPLPGAGNAPWRSEWLASWSNTGYLEAELLVKPPAVGTATEKGVSDGSAVSGDAASTLSVPALSTSAMSEVMSTGIHLSVTAVNCIDHLQGLKKTRGGLGSVGFDEKQKTMDSFFSRPAKKPKRDDGPA